MSNTDPARFPSSIETLRSTLRLFKRYALRLRDGINTMGQSGSLQFRLKWKQGRAPRTSFAETPELARYAALLRPFMAPGAAVELRAVWKTLTEAGDLVEIELREKVERLFKAAEDLHFGFVINGKRLTAHDVYYAYAEGEFFNEDASAKRLLDELSLGPVQFMPFLFYSACVNYSQLVFAILDAVLDIERRHSVLTPSLTSQPQCIYCLTREGDFSAKEHVIPEAFGNEELVLEHAVCGECNNRLSRLDRVLAEFEPLAFLRVQNVLVTKKGRFPRADLRDFVVQKVKPRLLQFTSKTGKRVFAEERQVDGSVRLSFKATLGKNLNVLGLARALFKIGVGLVAYDRGVDYACSRRFDAARSFIRGERTMPNHLLMLQEGKPHQSIETYWQSFASATVVGLDIFGMMFAVNLEPTELYVSDEASSNEVYAFWLGARVRQGGVPPCEAGCQHPIA